MSAFLNAVKEELERLEELQQNESSTDSDRRSSGGGDSLDRWLSRSSGCVSNAEKKLEDETIEDPTNFTHRYRATTNFCHRRLKRLGNYCKMWLRRETTTKTKPNDTIAAHTIDETINLYLYQLEIELALAKLPIPPELVRIEVPLNFQRLLVFSCKFKQRKVRKWVTEQADCIEMETLNYNGFRDILLNLYEDQVYMWEKILVLFYFCIDLSIRAIREKKVGVYRNISQFTVQFFSGLLPSLIEDYGGWELALSEPLPQQPNNIFVYSGFICFAVGILGMLAIKFVSRK